MFVQEKEAGEVSELDEASQTLLRAAEIIEQKGHCNHAAYGIDGSLCVHAAIAEAAGNSVWLMSKARVKLAGRERNITVWSNSSTETEVIAELRAVAFSRHV